jgi:hypothetical protein
MPLPAGTLLPLHEAASGIDVYDALLIQGLPRAARLSAGRFERAVGGWVLRPKDLEGLTLNMDRAMTGPVEIKLIGIDLDAGSPAGLVPIAEFELAMTDGRIAPVGKRAATADEEVADSNMVGQAAGLHRGDDAIDPSRSFAALLSAEAGAIGAR